jgi:UDP-N-acetyl-D-mannosaminuronate dehydrogenase
VAVGGHCIPVYPHFYLAEDPEARLPAAAREINSGMPEQVVAALEGKLGELRHRTVVVLGAAYRGGVKETAFSGVFSLVRALAARGAIPVVHDPLFTDDELVALGFEPYHLGEQAAAAIVHTDHSQYRELVGSDLPGVHAIYDGRWVIDPDRMSGISVLSIGRGLRGES